MREMWEEAGVKVWDIKYHSGQPWVGSFHWAPNFGLTTRKMVQPYPANLMVGFYARADATQPIRTDLDNELAGMYPPWLQLLVTHKYRCTMVYSRRDTVCARSFFGHKIQ